MQRRKLLLTAAGAGAALATPFASALAQGTWPTRPIRFVVPFPPGGGTDTTSRVVADKFNTLLNWTVVIDNKPGVSGIVGTQAVARAQPDGYTLMGGTITTHAVNAFFNKNLGYEQVKDFVPVDLVGMVSNVLVVAADSRFNSVAQITAELTAKPDSLTYGTAGAGTSQHLSGQLYQNIAHTRMRQIVYKGGSQAMVDLIGGQIDMVFETVAAARPMIDGKRVKVLAVTSTKRLASLPAVPTMAEAGVPGFEMQSWQGVFAPAGTPPELLARLSGEINQAVRSPDIQGYFAERGFLVEGTTPAVFRTFLETEVDKWTTIVKTSGAKPD